MALYPRVTPSYKDAAVFSCCICSAGFLKRRWGTSWQCIHDNIYWVVFLIIVFKLSHIHSSFVPHVEPTTPPQWTPENIRRDWTHLVFAKPGVVSRIGNQLIQVNEDWFWNSAGCWNVFNLWMNSSDWLRVFCSVSWFCLNAFLLDKITHKLYVGNTLFYIYPVYFH